MTCSTSHDFSAVGDYSGCGPRGEGRHNSRDVT
jgi:hypothetical protein